MIPKGVAFVDTPTVRFSLVGGLVCSCSGVYSAKINPHTEPASHHFGEEPVSKLKAQAELAHGGRKHRQRTAAHSNGGTAPEKREPIKREKAFVPLAVVSALACVT
jgi:hypothetical protein